MYKQTLDKTKEYVVSDMSFRIGEAAVTGMLYEVSTSPSPGLVSPISNGIHKDMDFFTFMRSTASISHAMALCAQVGMEHEEDVLGRIRKIGIEAERHMLNKTEGVNTQRGILFAAGVVSAAAGSCARNNLLNRHDIASQCARITSGIVSRELETAFAKACLTNGEKVYLKYGISGIRGELENGLLSVLGIGIPLYENALEHGHSLVEALTHSLIGLMSVVEDTVVLNRAGMEGFLYMRQSAKDAMAAGGMLTESGREKITRMEQEFQKRDISPGGAADMLAISVMIHELENIMRDYEIEKPGI